MLGHKKAVGANANGFFEYSAKDFTKTSTLQLIARKVFAQLCFEQLAGGRVG